ncbi:MAG: two-component system NtrC family sensor histidine kinase PilS [Halothiobacillaceae bacterium]|nr:MAG: two-component system NtrC family sensor histidine kinase PilS [Halothiobacillaceae bacterium]
MSSQAGAEVLGRYNHSLFFWTSTLYLASSLIHSFTIQRCHPSFVTQTFYQVIIDIAALVVLMHTSGSLQSGLGILLIVAIAGGSLLIAKRSAIFLAAIATISLLLEQTYTTLYVASFSANFTQAGLLGATLFAIAAVAQVLARRVRDSEALAAQRGVDLANMEQLTEYVIQRMQTGIVVVDSHNSVRLINQSAWHLLGTLRDNDHNPQQLYHLSPLLAAQLEQWRHHGGYRAPPLRASNSAAEVLPRFAHLGSDHNAGTLIFLEDTAAAAQQAQQLKLASLGRLTASIAHEIRNPLGAISHAGQLLAESPHLDSSETRLTQIILDHSKRMNTIIENVLQLSRRQASQPEEIHLASWLNHFIAELCHTRQIAQSTLQLRLETGDITVHFDPSQLQQIVWNLCQNGLRYTRPRADGIVLVLAAYLARERPTPCLDIIDFGPGVESSIEGQIFEPFFTTDSRGTGLGLYIARELCESNQARLTYQRTPLGESCFRITFTDQRRNPNSESA